MHFPAATFYLASLVAILVARTASLPQSQSGDLDGISRREAARFKYSTDKYVPQLDNPPRLCDRVDSTTYHIDIEEVDKRNSQSPDIDTGILDPRTPRVPFRTPCGVIYGDGQSDAFQVLADQGPLRPLVWKILKGKAKDEIVSIMKVNPQGQDHIIASTPANANYFSGFRATKGASYYISLTGSNSMQMSWFIPAYGLAHTLSSGALANQAQANCIPKTGHRKLKSVTGLVFVF
ncbi:hypothetical protein MMC07_000826 [Pseudocyphellaria aurata]|nr:hypothetical protein [Pseudocyphellaria aurata]